jgi:hypothetical protein
MERHVASEQPNEVLASLLTELGWSPRALARRINRAFGVGTVAETAPYHWRDAGRVPRPPLPKLTALVLSQEVGRPIAVSDLWQGHALDSPLTLPADMEMSLPWSRSGAMGIIEDWVVSGLLDRRRFLAVSGSALTVITSGYLTSEHGALRPAVESGVLGNPLLEQIQQSIPLLQRLDDANGGTAHLAYVGAQFRAVALLLRQGGNGTRVERRLFVGLAELGQLAGWMAFDAGQHGLAQRYFFSALRAADQAGYRAMAAHVLADLAFQAASRGQPADAISLGEAAATAAPALPATVQASVCTRLAYGYAIAGRIDDFDRAYGSALDRLANRRQDAEPAWMYFLTPNHLDTQAGYALVHAAVLSNDCPATARELLRRGDRLLRTGAHDVPHDDPSQRRALFEGAWLAVAAAGRGDLERACALGRVALARTETVQSVRSIDVLRTLAKVLRRRSRNEHVADFLPPLNATLARFPTAA